MHHVTFTLVGERIPVQAFARTKAGTNVKGIPFHMGQNMGQNPCQYSFISNLGLKLSRDKKTGTETGPRTGTKVHWPSVSVNGPVSTPGLLVVPALAWPCVLVSVLVRFLSWVPGSGPSFCPAFCPGCGLGSVSGPGLM